MATDPYVPSAAEVKRLRDSTGAGMMDCKRALVDTGGDFEAATKWLAEKGLSSMAKRTDRENDQGAVAIAANEGAAAIVQVKCETDFVAASPDFVKLTSELAELVLAKGEDAVAERQADVDNLKITLKENIEVGRVARFEAASGAVLDTYLHQQNNRGVNGVVVELQGGDAELAHDIAVHIAFGKPGYLKRDEVPAAEIEAQRELIEAQTRNEGKPDAAIPKIVEGKLGGWYKERVLLDQPFAKDDKKSVQQVLGAATITRFAQVVIGA